MSKLIFKNKKYYFDIFPSKKYFEKQYLPQTPQNKTYFTINYVQNQLFSTGCNYITLSLLLYVLPLSSVYFCV